MHDVNHTHSYQLTRALPTSEPMASPRSRPMLLFDGPRFTVTRTNGDDASKSHHPQQTTRYVEYHGEAHCRDSRRNSVAYVGVVRNHRDGIELRKVEMRNLKEERYAERHGPQS